MNISGCTELRKIPDELNLKSSLIMRNCPKVEELPANLRLGRHLDISGSTGIKEIPSNAEIGGGIIVRGCKGVRIPENVADGYPKIVGGANSDYEIARSPDAETTCPAP
ncbi:hypothetical protein WSS15_29960 [Acetobacter pasteurianus]|nr:hypothetical protein WSS15_29960 [Acetobacter pasteurianus]